jgi:CMP/dCMP kinase
LQKLSVNPVPVIAIDGPSASGKGTVAQRVAKTLGFHYLDSGALYRIVALAAKKNNVALDDGDALGEITKALDIEFNNGEIYMGTETITETVRSEEMSRGASEVAVHPQVRSALLDLQHRFRQAPGLVADGRDMASVVFTDAKLKVFLTAGVEVRARRRYNQLLFKNIKADYAQILEDLRTRDLRDSERIASPLIKTPDALLLDTSNRTIEDATQFILSAYIKIQ